MKLGIVGCGASGVLTYVELLRLGIPAANITIVDPFFDGGALTRYWGAVHSNTIFSQIQIAMEKYPQAHSKLLELAKHYQPDSTVLLSDLGALLRSCIQSAFLESNTVQETCKQVQQTTTGWILHTQTKEIPVDAVFVCQGGKQKELDIGKPVIPLEIALDPVRLRRYVQPGQKITIFGLAHSGTLVLKYLHDLDCNVYGIYKGETPFKYARDGKYDGIKQESADIADALQAKQFPNCELLSSSHFAQVIKAVQRSTWIVNATGFEGSPIDILDKDGRRISCLLYSPETAELQEGLYGFGLAYPGVTVLPEGRFVDVSIPSFQAQIERCLPTCLAKIRNRSLPLDGAKQDNQ